MLKVGNAPLLKFSDSLFNWAIYIVKPNRKMHCAFSFACSLPSRVSKSQCRCFRHPDGNYGSEKHGTKTGNYGHKPCSSKALFLCACVLSCCLQHKKQYSFQLSYAETETLESGFAKLMCRKALGVKLQRWVKAIMRIIKVRHAAYTRNC